MARAIKLINAPAGLFDIDGVLVLKTEYSTQHEDGAITPDCYIVDSGEYFWGGVDSVEERNNLMVTPIDMPTLTPPNEWVSVYDRLPEPGERVLATDCGFVGEFYINKRGKWQRYNVNCSELLMALDILYWMPLPAPPDRPKEGEKP